MKKWNNIKINKVKKKQLNERKYNKYILIIILVHNYIIPYFFNL